MQTVPEVSTSSRRAPTLARTAFTTDRALEFFSESELTTQMGYGRQLWPLIIVKELFDNALDGCEIGDTAPEIWLSLEPNAITVTDNGPGIPPEVIEKSLDYHVRISDKKHYVSPTRGQLGNALKCVWAAPFVANGAHSGLVEVSARGLDHRIEVNLDRIKQSPTISHTTAERSVKNGTSVKVHWNGIAKLRSLRTRHFLPARRTGRRP
jgi:DNA topoisomerase VI subunit B